MKLWKLAILMAAVVIAIPAACIILDKSPVYQGDSVVFLEYKNNTRGQLVYGNYGGEILDSEEYVYDPEHELLSCTGIPELNSSLRALVGTSRSLMQDAGYGVSTRLAAMYSNQSLANGLAVDTVFDDGTVELTYNGSRIKLSPGQRWVRVYTENLETDDYRVKLTNTEFIRNNGKIPVASIGSL